MTRNHHNYMFSQPGEGFCNPYANVDQDFSWLGKFASVSRDQTRVLTTGSSAPRSTASRPSKPQINLAATRALRQAWRRRKTELNGQGSPDSFKVIDPVQVLKDMGHSVDHLDTLGQFADIDGEFEVAGQIDPAVKAVWISRQFSPEVMRFTAAHELGHAILHRGMSLHRDRPVDGARSLRDKAANEVDADHFAACFLMPGQLVREEFSARFLKPEFVLNDDVAFALGYSDLRSAQKSCRTQEELARVLADRTFFNGRHFPSLAERFQVSVKAMAIRLQELGLVTRKSLFRR